MADWPGDAGADLLARIARGDRPALAELYARYRLSLFHYPLQFTLDPDLAEELLQDTLVAVWQHAGSFAAHRRAGARPEA